MAGTENLIISRLEMGLPDIECQARDAGYRVYNTPEFSNGSVEKAYASSVPWVHYDRPTHVRRTNGTYTLYVIVYGDTVGQMHQRSDALHEAVTEQYEFTVWHVIDGYVRPFQCIAADSFEADTTGGALDEVLHARHLMPYVITGPHMGRV